MTIDSGVKLSLDDAHLHQLASLVAAQVVEQFKTLGWAPQNGIPEHVKEAKTPNGASATMATAGDAASNKSCSMRTDQLP